MRKSSELRWDRLRITMAFPRVAACTSVGLLRRHPSVNGYRAFALNCTHSGSPSTKRKRWLAVSHGSIVRRSIIGGGASRMAEGLQALSEREKETLRLLLGGHDAKSIARALGLSVHTINERLRDARRKLGVASSREAARRLAEADANAPNSLVDKQLGVAETETGGKEERHSEERQKMRNPLFWLGGGMLIMSLIIAAAIFSATLYKADDGHAPSPSVTPAAATAVTNANSPSIRAAKAWVLLLDQEHWSESWDAAGILFKSQIQKERWASMIQPVRQPLGQLSSRSILSATRTSSLPGAPSGDYEIVEFRTNFAQKREAVETIVLAREGSDWKVTGYFIK